MNRSTSPPPGEGLSSHQRLRRRADFVRCYRRGGKRRGSLAVLHFHSNEEREARLGITASRKLGNAVRRHRVKRRVREIFRRFDGREDLAAFDIVVHLHPPAGRSTFPALRRDLERLLSALPRSSPPRSGERPKRPAARRGR